MRLIFAGTPEFAVPILEAVAAEHEIAAVLTQPDRPKGRALRLEPTPVKAAAARLGLPVLQPARLRDSDILQALDGLRARAIVVVAYGKILPPPVLELTPAGCVNVHPSLLPKYRGPAPIQRAIAAGETVTGVSIMKLDEGMDTGPVYKQAEVPIGPDETSGELAGRLNKVAAGLLLEVLREIEEGTAKPAPQPAEGTIAEKIEKEETEIDWSRTAKQIHDLVRALNPAPGAFTTFQRGRLKVWRTQMYADGPTGTAGEIVSVEPALLVATGSGHLRLLELQPENKKRMPAADFVRGYSPAVGTKLGGD
ncbi:MAG: methionyl-tRNA formyltransferase [Actinobacteria bacterium]|nr:MAG: methionyl-tRNA formyltransferase [Actinomycetota bacterium]